MCYQRIFCPIDASLFCSDQKLNHCHGLTTFDYNTGQSAVEFHEEKQEKEEDDDQGDDKEKNRRRPQK